SGVYHNSGILHGIDIYSGDGDAGINIATIPADFIIVKATQGTTYVNPYFQQHARETLAAGKLLGIYHFVDTTKGALNEARHFVNTIKGTLGGMNYIGKATLFLDWENNDVTGQNNIGKGPKYAKTFLDEVSRLTGGVKPLIYMSKHVTGESYNWKEVADAGYGLWMAQYLNKYYNNGVNGHVDNPTLIYDDASDNQKEWPKPTLYQYTSRGRLPGYSKELDMNVFYGTPQYWKYLASRR
ncbi:GH25 family lysozyme, partial [Olegusella massiliensis]|uniref:GH25 family lysozyme n=1 Tax=Olegusella massiliensis TaxID=1776381 RepID=UPI0040557082